MYHRVLIYQKSASTTEPCCKMWTDLVLNIAFTTTHNEMAAEHQINAGLATEMLYLSSQIPELQELQGVEKTAAT